ncbi:MAG: GH92 family glycosyl hydrolase [Bacteroidales bacterium]|nr:GH92 family glycosyl hydrolase [Bacteroidales bacterium]
MKKLITHIIFGELLAATFLFVSCKTNNDVDENENLTCYVNPMIGASTSVGAAGVYHGLGKTFPGATTPYGLVQVSPNTITGGDNGPGYSDEHKSIEGFAFTQMSGIGWYGDLGNFLVMPTTGDIKTIAGREDGSLKGYRSFYDKSSEKAKAGYYSVFLSDYGIKTECSATPRCGILRFTFPESNNSRIQIDLARRVGGTSTLQHIKVINDSTIEGWMKCPPEGGGWGNGDGRADYTVYFYATFSKPLLNYGFWSANIPDSIVRKREEVTSDKYQRIVENSDIIKGKDEMEGKHLGFFSEFETVKDEKVELKAGISLTGIDGARINYNYEIKNKSFEDVVFESDSLWNVNLNKIKIKGGTEDDKVVFYTALYHTMIDPRIISDYDGRYIGGDKKIHESEGDNNRRSIFSGWDVFRSQFPLQTLINPSLVNDEINSLINLAEETNKNYFERWEFLNAYSGCMIGNPAISVLADAYSKGIRNYDIDKAYQCAVNSSSKFGNQELGYTPEPLSISYTLEYAYADWCLSQIANNLGKKDDSHYYDSLSNAYKKVFDTEKGWFRPKRSDGSWVEWPEDAKIKEWYGCIEADPYQQGWFVPHDIEGMVSLIGGKEKALEELHNFFNNTPEDMHWNSYYNHANEPVHFVPYLFNRLGEPWNTQKWTRFICEHGYHNKVDGIVGNEDVGQMSAWYVLSSSGIHPVCPGDGLMEITSPVFDEVVFKLDNNYYKGKQFVIKAYNNSAENIYIQRMILNGKEYNKSNINFSDISKGGILELYMGRELKKRNNE